MILVAEQDAAVRSLMGSVLRDEGFHVLEASDDLKAARIAADEINTIDLIVADADMPLMGHPKLIQRLTLLRPDLKVLVIGNSGATLPRLPENVAVLSKPFTASAFLSGIERLLGARF